MMMIHVTEIEVEFVFLVVVNIDDRACSHRLYPRFEIVAKYTDANLKYDLLLNKSNLVGCIVLHFINWVISVASIGVVKFIVG